MWLRRYPLPALGSSRVIHWEYFTTRSCAVLTSSAPLSPALLRSSIHLAVIGSVAFFHAARSTPSMTWIGVFRLVTAARPILSHSSHLRPRSRESAAPELASITFLRSSGRPSYLALFITNNSTVL